jgi:processive 1,2-diacylglycerol beta-glucosyltransferase
MSAPVRILSGSIGSGHVAASAAVGAALAGHDVAALDCMGLLGGGPAKLGEAAFRRLLGWPPLYDAFYFGALRPGGRLATAMERAAQRRLLPALRRELPRDAVLVATFPTGVAAAGELRRGGQSAAALVVVTDVTAHRLWTHPGVDAYVVAGPAGAASVRRHQPTARVEVLPPPVRPAFYRAPDRAAARAALRLPDAPCVLMMTGGWGLADVSAAAAGLADSGVTTLVVAGRNERLHRTLAALDRPGLRPVGWTQEVPALMAAAEVVVAPPGQTCHEARVVGRRLVVLDTMPGHGRDNVQDEVARGAAVCGPRAGQLVSLVQAVLAIGSDPAPEHTWEAFAGPLRSLVREFAGPT